jgi:tetratricopeptide (TPR) repeat protein
MKKRIHGFLAAGLVSLLFAACGSSPDSAAESGTAGAKPSGPYYQGEGGKGIRIAVLAPQPQNLAEDETWLPLFVQGSLTNILTNFSAMTVIDRQNDQMIKAEQLLSETGYYSDKNAVEIGNMLNAQYILAGHIIKTPAGMYSLQTAVSDAASAELAASYNADCTAAQLKNGEAVNLAASGLLEQMKVELTASGKSALSAQSESSAKAQSALSRAITAQKDGAVAEAMTLFQNALSLDSSLGEAEKLFQTLTADVTSGNIGESVRGEIARHNTLLKIFTDAEEYYTSHPPYILVYDAYLIWGDISRSNRRKASFEFTVRPDPSSFQVIKQLMVSTLAIQEELRLENWPFRPASTSVFGKRVEGSKAVYDFPAERRHAVQFEAVLLNDQGKAIAKGGGSMYLAMGKDTTFLGEPKSLVVSYPGETVSQCSFDVPVAEMTKTMTLQILSLDGVSAGSGNVTIVQAAKKIPRVDAEDEAFEFK